MSALNSHACSVSFTSRHSCISNMFSAVPNV